MDTTIDVEGVTNLLVDLFDTGVTVTFQTTLDSPTWNNTPFNGLVLTSFSNLGISSPVVDPATTLGGFDASRVNLSGNDIQLNFAGLSYTNGSVVAVNFTDLSGTNVPEPASAALLAMGLTGVALLRRRR